MRWDSLFDDLEGQLDAAHDEQFRAEVADRTRGERASIALAARIGASRGRTLSLVLADGERVHGIVAASGAEWVLMESDGRQHLVPMRAVSALGGLAPQAAELSTVESRLGLAHTLRALSRDRARVRVCGAHEWTGVIAAVFADHVDVRVDGDAHALSIPLGTVTQVVSA